MGISARSKTKGRFGFFYDPPITTNYQYCESWVSAEFITFLVLFGLFSPSSQMGDGLPHRQRAWVGAFIPVPFQLLDRGSDQTSPFRQRLSELVDDMLDVLSLGFWCLRSLPSGPRKPSPHPRRKLCPGANPVSSQSRAIVVFGLLLVQSKAGRSLF